MGDDVHIQYYFESLKRFCSRYVSLGEKRSILRFIAVECSGMLATGLKSFCNHKLCRFHKTGFKVLRRLVL